jgi:hypothetical protein
MIYLFYKALCALAHLSNGFFSSAACRSLFPCSLPRQGATSHPILVPSSGSRSDYVGKLACASRNTASCAARVRRLGVRRVEMVRKYAHLSSEHLTEYVDRLFRLIESSRKRTGRNGYDWATLKRKRSQAVNLTPCFNGAPEEIRTPAPLVRSSRIDS